jgi:hypothetical protein
MSSVTLTTRYGHSHKQPLDADLEAALKDVYVENHPSLTEADYEEHPNAWLIYGEQNGEKWTIHTLDVYRGGTVIYSKMDDQDDDDPEFEKEMNGVSLEHALGLWRLLAQGKTTVLVAEHWG